MAEDDGEAGAAGGAARSVGCGCFAATAAGWAGRCPFDGDPVPGSGVMMLTAGVLAALGNSALVGLPVGTDAGSPASGMAAGGGAFQAGA